MTEKNQQENMTEKNQQEKNAAERQVALLVNAFDKAQENGGVWLNKDGKKAPSFYQKGVSISPFNAIILGLHSDQDNYKTNEYTPKFLSERRVYLAVQCHHPRTAQ